MRPLYIIIPSRFADRSRQHCSMIAIVCKCKPAGEGTRGTVIRQKTQLATDHELSPFLIRRESLRGNILIKRNMIQSTLHSSWLRPFIIKAHRDCILTLHLDTWLLIMLTWFSDPRLSFHFHLRHEQHSTHRLVLSVFPLFFFFYPKKWTVLPLCIVVSFTSFF